MMWSDANMYDLAQSCIWTAENDRRGAQIELDRVLSGETETDGLPPIYLLTPAQIGLIRDQINKMSHDE